MAEMKPFDPVVFEQMLDQIAKGDTLKDVLSEKKPGFPDSRTFYRWLKDDPARRKGYEAAQEERAEMMVDEMLALVDYVDDTSSVCVQAARLKTDVRKWMASKYSNRFSDKQQIDMNANVKTDYASILEAARRRSESGTNAG